jgi:hypothetical protein
MVGSVLICPATTFVVVPLGTKAERAKAMSTIAKIFRAKTTGFVKTLSALSRAFAKLDSPDHCAKLM